MRVWTTSLTNHFIVPVLSSRLQKLREGDNQGRKNKRPHLSQTLLSSKHLASIYKQPATEQAGPAKTKSTTGKGAPMHAKCKCQESSHGTRAGGWSGAGGGWDGGGDGRQKQQKWLDKKSRRRHRGDGKASRSEWWREREEPRQAQPLSDRWTCRRTSAAKSWPHRVRDPARWNPARRRA